MKIYYGEYDKEDIENYSNIFDDGLFDESDSEHCEKLFSRSINRFNELGVRLSPEEIIGLKEKLDIDTIRSMDKKEALCKLQYYMLD